MRSLRPNGSKSFKTLNRGPIRNTTEILDPHSFACQSAATSRTDPTSAPACAVLSRPGTGVHEPSLSLAASFASGTRLPIMCGQPLPQMDRSFRVPPPTARTPPTLRLAAEGSIIARSLHIRPQRLTGRPAGQGIAEKQPASLAGQRPATAWRRASGRGGPKSAGRKVFSLIRAEKRVEKCEISTRRVEMCWVETFSLIFGVTRVKQRPRGQRPRGKLAIIMTLSDKPEQARKIAI